MYDKDKILGFHLPLYLNCTDLFISFAWISIWTKLIFRKEHFINRFNGNDKNSPYDNTVQYNIQLYKLLFRFEMWNIVILFQELNLCGCSRGALTGDCILLHASARCHNLTHVDASWCMVTDSGIGAISSSCKR